MIGFEKTFKDRVETSCRKIIMEKPYLRIPVYLAARFIFMVQAFWLALIGGWKKYAFTSFLLINILIGSSFSYPVFGERDGFISTQESYEAVPVPESTIKLMSDDEIYYPDVVFENEMENEEYDSYTLEDILAERDIMVSEDITEEYDETLVFSADDWRLILVNKQHPIPEDYEYVLGTISGNMKCDERIIDDLVLMMQRAQTEGVELRIVSHYRDLAHQEQLFNRKIDSYMRRGSSYLEAYKYSAHTITVPGTSEHEIGLAFDITSRNYTSLNAGFADTLAGRWLAEHSYEYGFILRYPLGKEYITGIMFEPWHFRYVGKEAAKVMKEEELTLEEFVEKYVTH